MRSITPEELAIIRRLLQLAGVSDAVCDHAEGALVLPMADGGMGSVQFASNKDRPRRTRQVAHGVAADRDGVLLDMTVNLDQDGQLFELDIWRVDFAPIQRYPAPEEINPVARNRE